jgi:hypothetical protein
MEDFLESSGIKNLDFFEIKKNQSSQTQISNPSAEIIANKEDLVDLSSISHDPLFIENPNYLGFMKDKMGKRDVLMNEKWARSQTIQSKVVNVTDDSVFLDCLVDVDSLKFQHRKFPKELFVDIRDLGPGKLIIIKSKSKPGSSRLDVYSGEGIVPENLFKPSSNWESLKDAKLDEKLSSW